MKQFQFFNQQLRNICGTVVECGIGNEHTLKCIFEIFKDRKIIGIDSFKGFPQASKHDNVNGAEKIRKINLRAKQQNRTNPYLATAQNIRQKMQEQKIDGIVIEGFFEDVLPHQYSYGPIALLHLDCDLYSSYKHALSLYDFVATGGIVAFDEYNIPRWAGATKAINEFLHNTKLQIRHFQLTNFKKYYIVKDK